MKKKKKEKKKEKHVGNRRELLKMPSWSPHKDGSRTLGSLEVVLLSLGGRGKGQS